VVPFLASFAERYPAVHISLSIGNSEEILDSLAHYRADVAVVADVEADPRLERILCAEHRLVAFVPRQHAWARRRGVRIHDFEDQPIIMREIGSKTRQLLELAMAKAKVRSRVVMEIESREAVREAVAAGLGIGVVSEAEFGHDERLIAVPITEAELGTREYLVCLRERRRLRIVSAFLDQAYRRLERLKIC
jgi:DNA-binding transcriptional LysR family regulator